MFSKNNRIHCPPYKMISETASDVVEILKKKKTKKI